MFTLGAPSSAVPGSTALFGAAASSEKEAQVAAEDASEENVKSTMSASRRDIVDAKAFARFRDDLAGSWGADVTFFFFLNELRFSKSGAYGMA